MGQALYRKYRSKSLSEIVGQEHITQALEQAIKTNRISHAYLLTGPRGVGKTSIARILAHEINHLPYEDDSAHLDIIEIDAASNRRIDEIRELRDKVYVAPTSAAYKVYIIDEVHMLTREAFNALLKTLEEPPAHVIFILATTDAHKLPATIVSRTQRYSFKPVGHEQVVAHLKHIAELENIAIDDASLGLIAEHGEGSLRDSLGLLDQASNQADAVTIESLQNLLGIPPLDSLQQLVDSLQGSNVSACVQLLSGLYDQGYQAAAIAKQLAQLLRSQITTNTAGLPTEQSLTLLTKLLEVPVSHDAERYLEIILLEIAAATTSRTQPVKAVPLPEAVPAQSPPVAPKLKSVAEPVPDAQASQSIEAVEIPEEISVADGSLPQAVVDEAIWPAILSALKQKYNTLYGIVRMAQPDFSEPGKLTMTFAFAFHQKRISDAKNRKVVADTIAQLTGQQVEIICLVDADLQLKKIEKQVPSKLAAPGPGTLDTISNIFGGGELLES